MSFGYSVGDFIAVGQLAWRVYKSCKDAPESFSNISVEVLSLHALLKEMEETLRDESLSVSRQESLATITRGCEGVLKDLESLVIEYESLGSQSKRTWDRMKWGREDIGELRARLTSNTTMLTAFMSTSQIAVERKLNKLIQEFQEGRHEGTINTVATIDSLTLDDRQSWRTIRKELEDIGISIAAFDANKGFIMQWFQVAKENGLFEEQGLVHDSEFLHSGSESSSTSQYFHYQTGGSGLPSSLGHTPERGKNDIPAPLVKVRVARSKNTQEAPRATQTRQKAVQDAPPESRSKKPIPRKRPLALILAVGRVLRYNSAFLNACRDRYLIRAAEMLRKGADINAFGDNRTALGWAAFVDDVRTARWLLENRADVDFQVSRYKGSDVDLQVSRYKGSDVDLQASRYKGSYMDVEVSRCKGSALQEACCNASAKMVALLLRYGADVEGADRTNLTPLERALQFGNTEAAKLLLAHGARIPKDLPLQFAFRHALDMGYDETAKVVIEQANDLTKEDWRKNLNMIGLSEFEESALHAAARGNCKDSIMLLLRMGMDIEARGNLGLTALDIAVSNEDLSIARLLISTGAINNYEEWKCARASKFSISKRHRLRSMEGYQRLAEDLRRYPIRAT